MARELGGRRAGLLAAFAWLAVLPQAYYAKTMNLDAPYLFWFALALLAFVRLRAETSARRGLAFGAAAAAAVLTKDQAYALFVLPALLLLWDMRRATTRPVLARALAAAAAVAAAMALASYRLWNGTAWFESHVRAVLAHPTTYGFTSPDLAGRWDALQLAIRHVAWVFGLPLFLLVAALAALALWRLVRNRNEGAFASATVLLFPLSYALFGLAPLGYQYDRFFLPVCLALLAVAAIELGRRLESMTAGPLRTALAVAFFASAGWGVARAVAVDLAMAGDRRVALEAGTRDLARAAAFVHAVRSPHGFVPILTDPARKPHSPVPLDSLSPFALVAIPAADLGDFGLSRLAESLRSGACGFSPAYPELAVPTPLERFPGFAGVLSNLGEIDPPLLLFARSGPLASCR